MEADASEAFPGRPGYKQWIRRLQRLLGQVGRLVRAAALRALRTETRRLYVADSLPIPVCELIRHGRVRLLSEDGAKFGRSAKGWFSGFQMHASVHQPTGVVVTAIPLPTGRDDREAVQALAMSKGGGLLLGDQGYSEEDTFDWLCGKAQVLGVMLSDEGKEGLSIVSQVLAAHRK